MRPHFQLFLLFYFCFSSSRIRDFHTKRKQFSSSPPPLHPNLRERERALTIDRAIVKLGSEMDGLQFFLGFFFGIFYFGATLWQVRRNRWPFKRRPWNDVPDSSSNGVNGLFVCVCGLLSLSLSFSLFLSSYFFFVIFCFLFVAEEIGPVFVNARSTWTSPPPPKKKKRKKNLWG